MDSEMIQGWYIFDTGWLDVIQCDPVWYDAI